MAVKLVYIELIKALLRVFQQQRPDEHKLLHCCASYCGIPCNCFWNWVGCGND